MLFWLFYFFKEIINGSICPPPPNTLRKVFPIAKKKHFLQANIKQYDSSPSWVLFIFYVHTWQKGARKWNMAFLPPPHYVPRLRFFGNNSISHLFFKVLRWNLAERHNFMYEPKLYILIQEIFLLRTHARVFSCWKIVIFKETLTTTLILQIS